MSKANQRPTAGVIVAVVLLLISAMLFFSTNKGSVASRLGSVYYYDLQTGELFDEQPLATPIAAPSGRKAVRARLFACGSCDDPAQPRSGYLEMYDDSARQQLLDGATPEMIADSRMVSRIPQSGDPQWVPYDSEAGEQIRSDPLPQCADEIECRP